MEPVLMISITNEEYQNLKRVNDDLRAKILSITQNERLREEKKY